MSQRAAGLKGCASFSKGVRDLSTHKTTRYGTTRAGLKGCESFSKGVRDLSTHKPTRYEPTRCTSKRVRVFLQRGFEICLRTNPHAMGLRAARLKGCESFSKGVRDLSTHKPTLYGTTRCRAKGVRVFLQRDARFVYAQTHMLWDYALQG